jgi:RHS repeat-associated protein
VSTYQSCVFVEKVHSKRRIHSTRGAHYYGYSPSGLRVERVKNPTGVNVAGLPTGGDGVRHLLSGSEEIADLDRERNVIRRYIPGAAIDERVAQLDAAGNVVFIHNDRQNSVIAISNILGAVIQKRAYGTYGETNPSQMTLQPNATTIHPFGYTGRRWDPDLGLYYYRARWYDPTLGTFLETDPIGSLDYVNLYAYVGLEPGNGVDPTGMMPGDHFPTPMEALVDALQFANPISIRTNLEMSGVVNRMVAADGGLSYVATFPMFGSLDGQSAPQAIRRTTTVAAYHTHGDYSTNVVLPGPIISNRAERIDQSLTSITRKRLDTFDGDHFSTGDLQNNALMPGLTEPARRVYGESWISGLGTPRGSLVFDIVPLPPPPPHS